jgi:hypothetical protein
MYRIRRRRAPDNGREGLGEQDVYASSALVPVDYPVSPAVATTGPANGSLIQARHSEPG